MLQMFDQQSFSRLDKSETDSGCHIQVMMIILMILMIMMWIMFIMIMMIQDPEELVTELQARMVEMEKELRVSKDQYKC